MNSILNAKHQAKLLKKWAPILESGSKIESDFTKSALAQVLENTRNFYARKGLLTEAGVNGLTQGSIVGKNQFTSGGGVLNGDWGMNVGKPGSDSYGDYYMPNIVMPLLRRIFPDLIANELVGVQPLNGPIGLVLALRAKYNDVEDGKPLNQGWLGDGTHALSDEIGYNSPDNSYTGVLSGDELDDAQKAVASSYWGEYDARWNGVGKELGVDSEYASMADGTYPTVGFDLIKSGVMARTRKLGAQWSPELAEDMEAMHGIDVEKEFINIMSYEIGAEIDRQILTEMVKAAITGGNVSTWDPSKADGLDQMGRLATLLTQITIEANQIALRTRRGNANFVVASPKVTALLEQMSLEKFISFASGKAIPTVPYSGVGAIQKQGLINDGQQLLVRDAYAKGNYVLMGYKGVHPGDSGIIYCPYIPIQLSKVLRPDTFTPAIGARTRYGVMNSPWDAKRYYHFMKIEGLTSEYTWSGPRRFIAPVSDNQIPV